MDPEAELIIGAITDPQLEGKMRVSIVATSLDGQQPESKSVINMVHRIQNRNPGYSDFSGMNISESFNFQNSTSSPISEGATALKLEDEVHQNNATELNETQYSEDSHTNSVEVSEASHHENLVNQTNDIQDHEDNMKEPSNGLENFGLQEEGSFEIFDDNKETQNSLAEEENEAEEDELEIPAFLRRQKN